MSLDYFRIERGLDINGNVVIFEGVGPAGGTTDTDEALIGSVYIDTGSGTLYVKNTAGAGLDKWSVQASKSYVDSVASGLDLKSSVKVATTGPLPASTAAGTGAGKTLTLSAAGILTVDGVSLVLGDRLLVKDQALTHADHGIYTVTTEGTISAAAVLTRSTDADTNNEVTAGMFVFVTDGTANADTGWALVTNDPINLDTTALQFSAFSSSTTSPELAFIRSFIGKDAAGSETPIYTSTNFVSTGTSLETAIGSLDAELGPNVTTGTYIAPASNINTNIQSLDTSLAEVSLETSANNVTAAVTLDSVPVATTNTVIWMVQAVNAALSTSRYTVTIQASNDGASSVKYTATNGMKHGSNINGLDITVDMSAGTMRLRVNSTTSVNVTARRVTAF